MYALTFLSLLVAACAPLAASMGAPPQVPIAVYYESLCPDSIKFFTTQLYTAYTSTVKPRMNVTLVPFGKSSYKQEGTDFTFECHHGPNECYGNKVQACAIRQLTDQPKLLSLLNCLMGSALADRNGTYPIAACGEKMGVNIEEIVSCANGTLGSQYLAALGELTKVLSPPLTSVPTIIFNNTYSETNQQQALTNLRGLVCSMIVGDKPTDCIANSASVLSVSFTILLSIFAGFSVL